MKRTPIVLLVIFALLLSSCEGGTNALVHLNGRITYCIANDEGTLGNPQKESLNKLLRDINSSLPLEEGEKLCGEEIARFYNEKKDRMVALRLDGDRYYIYCADIIGGGEHSKLYYNIPADTAAYIIDVLETL